MKKKHIIIFSLAIGVVLRLYGLGFQSLGMDELWTAKSLLGTNFSTYMKDWVLPDPHTPIHPVLLYYWCKMLGNSEISLRLPSAIFGILSIFFCYILGKKILNDDAQLKIFVVLNALSTTAIQYSQEARTYSLLYLGSVLSTLMVLDLLRLLKENNYISNSKIFSYLLSCVICAFSHYFGMAYIYTQMALLLFYSIKLNKYDFRIYGLALFIILLTLSWCVFHYPHIVNMKFGNSWLPFTDSRLILNFITHVFGRPALEMKIIRESQPLTIFLSYLLIAVGPIFFIVTPFLLRPFGLFSDLLKYLKNGNTNIVGALYLSVFPFVMFYVLGKFIKLVWVHYLLFLLPPIYFMISIWISIGLKKWKNASPLYVLLCGLVIVILWSYTFYAPYKDDSRKIVSILKADVSKNPNYLILKDGFLLDYYIEKNKFDKNKVIEIKALSSGIFSKYNIDTIFVIAFGDGTQYTSRIRQTIESEIPSNFFLSQKEASYRALFLKYKTKSYILLSTPFINEVGEFIPLRYPSVKKKL